MRTLYLCCLFILAVMYSNYFDKKKSHFEIAQIFKISQRAPASKTNAEVHPEDSDKNKSQIKK